MRLPGNWRTRQLRTSYGVPGNWRTRQLRTSLQRANRLPDDLRGQIIEISNLWWRCRAQGKRRANHDKRNSLATGATVATPGALALGELLSETR